MQEPIRSTEFVVHGPIRSTESIINLMNNAPFLTMLLIFTFLVIWFTLRMRLRLLRFVETSIVSIINKELGKKINIVNKEIHSINEEIQSLKEDKESLKTEIYVILNKNKEEILERAKQHSINNTEASIQYIKELNSNLEEYLKHKDNNKLN